MNATQMQTRTEELERELKEAKWALHRAKVKAASARNEIRAIAAGKIKFREIDGLA